jgi:hypothetical protein
MTNTVVKAANFKNEKVSIAENIRATKFGGKSVFVNYQGGPLRIQFPKMSLPFGISRFEDTEKGDIKYSLEMSLEGIDEKILSELQKMEDTILNYVEKNSKEFFKKQQSKEVLKEFYSSFIRRSEDQKYAPRLKVKMYMDGTNFQTLAFDSEKVDGKYPKVNLNVDNIDQYIGKGSKCEAILQASGIWVVGKMFGISFSLVQAKIYKNENMLTGYAFEDSDEDEDKEEDIEDHFNDEEDHFDEESKLIQEKPVKKTRRTREKF